MLRFVIFVAVLLLATTNISAGPCPANTVQQAAWVNRNVDLLISKAHNAYEKESAEAPYNSVLAGIARTIKQCKFSGDAEFVNRYQRFLEYVRVLSLAQLKDHELGFEATDQVYFAETQKFVTIPDFLLQPEFLLAVKRFETLPTAKALLRTMNEQRPNGEKLLFFSFESRHLGTPDNDFSYRRLLVVVPGDPQKAVPEKWVQFGIADPGKRVPVRNLSVVAVVPGESGA